MDWNCQVHMNPKESQISTLKESDSILQLPLLEIYEAPRSITGEVFPAYLPISAVL